MSLMICSSDSRRRLHHRQVLALLRLERRVSSSSAVRPMMPFIGVRISWLMLARNSLLMRLAFSAGPPRLFELARLRLQALHQIAGHADRAHHPRAQTLGGARRQRDVRGSRRTGSAA